MDVDSIRLVLSPLALSPTRKTAIEVPLSTFTTGLALETSLSASNTIVSVLALSSGQGGTTEDAAPVAMTEHFCCLTFVAKERCLDQLCGSNGLPLTPNSIKILGRSRHLISLDHKNLATYIDVQRGKHERTVVVCERPLIQLAKHMFQDWIEITLFAKEVLEGLAYLHRNDVVHRCLGPDNIFLNNNVWKLFNFGLYYMTGDGADVNFPIGSLKYMAPEVILNSPDEKSSSSCDVWSFGLVLVEVLFGCDLWPNQGLRQIVKNIIGLLAVQDVLQKIANECGKSKEYAKLPAEMKQLVSSMLKTDPNERLPADQLLNLEIFRLVNFEFAHNRKFHRAQNRANLNHDALVELYHYWQLSGGDVYSELKKNGLIHNKPPILSLPCVLMLEGMQFGDSKAESQCLGPTVIPLNVAHLLARFQKLPVSFRYPELSSRASDGSESSSLPLAIKERDSEYQFRRIQIFKHLLKDAERHRASILVEASRDIPPLLRAKIWALILSVKGNYQDEYDAIDKESPAVTDRQIEVDIPRCHQYNELLSSNAGHLKFKRILKAWVKSHPHYVYWQGLDSLCAPFLFLNFHNEGRAYASLTKFIDKYLHNFFLKDNSAVIREYLAKLKHLIAFLDPVLACHLLSIGFSPELFAIPWFLTMFSHVLPIHKILYLWDALLLRDSSHPLFIGYSILQQFRGTLLKSGFNECILLFSDLPDIDIEKCVQDSLLYYSGTPRSITYRKHDLNEDEDISRFGMDSLAIPLKCLQDEISPRISAKELSYLVLKPATRSKLLVIDIRDQSLYRKQSLVGSINIPFTRDGRADGKNGDVASSKLDLHLLMSHQGKLIIVAGDDMSAVSMVCYQLVQSSFPKVCCLNGGLSSLSNSEILR
ncbi:TBC [Nesidiocoris tenuis]|uniref:TBC n=1 Tax=Nesidiocoris tenuis TaxID=355587 RepID=A0ABN7AFB3_9HEMI|nr:TBC [Nesidiocoris tenuis]